MKRVAAQARDVDSTFARLSAPKTARGYDPTPGEKVCLMYNQTSGRPRQAEESRFVRSVNLERLADMAKPKRRAGGHLRGVEFSSEVLQSRGPAWP